MSFEDIIQNFERKPIPLDSVTYHRLDNLVKKVTQNEHKLGIFFGDKVGAKLREVQECWAESAVYDFKINDRGQVSVEILVADFNKLFVLMMMVLSDIQRSYLASVQDLSTLNNNVITLLNARFVDEAEKWVKVVREIIALILNVYMNSPKVADRLNQLIEVLDKKSHKGLSKK